MHITYMSMLPTQGHKLLPPVCWNLMIQYSAPKRSAACSLPALDVGILTQP